ncbi:uncharacterized protein [Elaeis guineensis]|uniref:uncharacterized protein isoform X1 n=2 Tax=Elaeis guineensis var. tenera TaxID=51953 RepID=UPI003C6D7682
MFICNISDCDFFFSFPSPSTPKMTSATQLVLRAHKEAVNSLSGNGSAKLGTVATAVAAANSTAMEASKEIEAAMKISMRAALGLMTNKPNEDHLDDLTIMKETLRVKDEELQQLAKDLRARDSTIKEIADKLTETAEAAEAAASAAHAMDDERRLACAEIERLNKEAEKQLESSMLKLRESEEKVLALSREREILLKQRDSALQEAQLWRSELAKARERAVILEAAVLRAEERARVAEAGAEARTKDAAEKAVATAKEKEDLLALVNILQSQAQRQQGNTKQVVEERSESCSGADDTLSMTKHVDLSEDDVDKACLCDSGSVPGNNVVRLAVDGVEIHSIGDAEWSDIQSTDARIADVREVTPEAEQNSFDISVVNPPVDNHQHRGSSSQP